MSSDGTSDKGTWTAIVIVRETMEAEKVEDQFYNTRNWETVVYGGRNSPPCLKLKECVINIVPWRGHGADSKYSK